MPRNKKGRDINGVILIDKGTELSSNTVLQRVKRLFNAKKAGHTGSLDPLASGILPICLGQATKIAGFLLDDDKRYFVRGKLGQTTDTGDAEGKIIATQAFAHLTQDLIVATVQSFVGEIEQVPPMYSALKKNGQPLYKLARQGIEVERKARPVTIYNIIYLDYQQGLLSLEVSCSKGTYIRTLIEDIGNKLSCGAHVVELRRTGFAHLDITQALTIEALEAIQGTGKNLEELLFSSENMLPDLDSVYLNKDQSTDIKFGRIINQLQKPILSASTVIKLFDENKQFLGVGEAQENQKIGVKRLFI